MKKIIIAVCCFISLSYFVQNSYSESSNGIPSASTTKEFISPDKEFKATVIPIKEKNGESKVEIYNAKGKLLVNKNYVSEDGEHGSIVAQAKWTPDSNYFLYSMYSSGGHQPWHSPIDFYNRKDNTIRSLEDSLAYPIAESEFVVKAPDYIKMTLTKFGDNGIQKSFETELELSEIVDRCVCSEKDTFTVHGRLSYYNGNPSRRIWIIGTKRMLGVREECKFPDYIQKKLNWENAIYGDFVVCPLTKYKPGVMQVVIVKSGSHLVTQKY